MALVRKRFSAYAFKIETTPGVDAFGGSPVLADFVLGSGSYTYNPQMIQDPSFTGSLDTAPGMVGAFMPQITLNVPLRGSGAAGTAPPVGKILKCCGFGETADPTGIAAAALAAGSTTTGTLGTGYTGTAQLYRGLPAILAVNPSAGAISPIVDYTSGKVATFGETFGSALDTSTTVAIPPNVIYKPLSERTDMKTGTLYCYEDGLLQAFTGVSGDVGLDLTSGGSGMVGFSLRGKYGGAPSEVTLPTALTAGNATALPIWVAGKSRFGGDLMRCRSLSVRMGNTIAMPDNPESADGYDYAEILSRACVTTLDPLVDTSKQAALIAAFKAGTAKSLYALIGSAAGNRFLISQPSVRQMAGDPGDRGGLGTNQIRAEANLAGAPVYIVSF